MAGRIPCANGINNVWMMSGFGSRGLIHHSLVAEYLVKSILANDENIIPSCLKPMLRSSK
jgi:hypothetical protein